MKKFLLVMLLLAVALTAMANGRKDAGTEDVIDLTVTMSPQFEIGVTQQPDNPDNVISPYLAERFGLRVSEILKVPGDMTYPQALVMWKAAGMEEIKATTVDPGIRPSPEQLAINPPVDTPEAFLELLRRIKAADLEATDGSDMIPFSMASWETWHLGVMFDWGYWRINEEGDVDGCLGLPGTEEYMRWLWTACREGLIDPDYFVHKSVQLQEKVAIGKVVMGEYVPDAKGTFARLSANVPGSTRRFIAFPKSNPEYGPCQQRRRKRAAKPRCEYQAASGQLRSV